MSLQVWLPLTKDLRNQGLNNISVTNNGATYQSTGGKLGGTYTFGNGSASSNGLFLGSNLVDLMQNEYSVAVWVKPMGNHYHYNGTIFSSGNWNKTCYAFGLSQDNSQVDILCRGFNTYITCAVPVNTWTHLVCTCDSNNIVRLYKNGEYIGSSTRRNKPDSDNATQAAIGRETYASGYFTFNGMLNDFRLYDHCLSQTEVKEISKGLILHYPLNRSGLGQENFYTGNGIGALSNTSSVSNNGYESTFVLSAQGGVRASNLGFNGKTGPWTASFDIKSSVNTTITIDICDRGYNTATYGTSLTKDVWTHKSFIVTTATNQYNVSGNYNGFIDFNCGAAGTYNIKNLKVEEGIIETPWCPASSSTLGQGININSIIEYDCSGYCNNGTRAGNFSWTSDTPRYSTSTIFPNNCNTRIFNTEFPQITKNLTFACWCKVQTGSNSTYSFIVSQGRDKTASGFNLILYNSKFAVHGPFGTVNSNITTDNTWTHLVGTYGGATVKIYINGELKNSLSYTSDLTYTYGPAFVVGKMAYSYTSNSYYFPTNGNISDVRVYATALSAEDILELYHTAARIDNVGNTYVYQYIET